MGVEGRGEGGWSGGDTVRDGPVTEYFSLVLPILDVQDCIGLGHSILISCKWHKSVRVAIECSPVAAMPCNTLGRSTVFVSVVFVIYAVYVSSVCMFPVCFQCTVCAQFDRIFLATLVALHFTPVSE